MFHKQQSKSTYFTVFLAGILWGILLWNTLSDITLSLLFLSFVIVVSCYIFLFLRSLYIFILLWLFSCLLWLCTSLYHAKIFNQNSEIVSQYTWLYWEYSGRVKKVYKRSDFYDEYVMSLSCLHGQNISENIDHLLRVPKNFSLSPWELVKYSWKVYPLEDFDGFAYRKYMLSKDIYFSTSTNSLDIYGEDISAFQKNIYTLREDLLSQIHRIFPKQEAIFLSGILFWARENIPHELKEDFNNSWLTHFIAVSGFNITICIIFMSVLCSFLPYWIRFTFITISIILFTIFVWWWAPVVRASIMWILGYVFLQSGNKTIHLPVLAFTAVTMTYMNPYALSYDVSLHLSFLAVIGIIYTQNMFQKLFWFIPNIFAIREALVLTLAALSFSIPIMVFNFGQVSLLAPLANIAVTWTIPLAMLTGSLTLIFDYIHPLLWQIIWFVSWTLLKYDMMMVSLFWNIDIALWQVDTWPLSVYFQALYIITLSYIITFFGMKRNIN